MDTHQTDALPRTQSVIPAQPSAPQPEQCAHHADREWDVPPGSAPRGTVVVLASEGVGWYEELARRIGLLGFRCRGFHTTGTRPLDLGRRVARVTRGLQRPLVLVGSGAGALLALRFAHWGDAPASGVVAASPPGKSDDRVLDDVVDQAWTGHGRMPVLLLHAAEEGLDTLNDLGERMRGRPSFRLATLPGPAAEVLGGPDPSGIGDITGFLRRIAPQGDV
jgi:hypothetical protein